jgi:hypothetical protein
MVEIKFIVLTEKFESDVKKIKNKGLKERLEKQIKKVIENPNFGKPLRYSLRNNKFFLIISFCGK